MNHTKRVLTLSILIAALLVPAAARTELLEETRPFLIARPHPQLSRINTLGITIILGGVKVDKNNPVHRGLEPNIRRKLLEAGIGSVENADQKQISKSLGTPQFRIYIDTLNLGDTSQRAFLVRTSLARQVYLAGGQGDPQHFGPGSALTAEVWTHASAMQLTSADNLLAQITDAVLQQTDVFTAAWIAANPPGQRLPDGNEIATIPKDSTAPPVESPVAASGYVASKNSKVFHSPSCRFAGTISAKNLVAYKTRDEAVNAGKRPCKTCKP